MMSKRWIGRMSTMILDKLIIFWVWWCFLRRSKTSYFTSGEKSREILSGIMINVRFSCDWPSKSSRAIVSWQANSQLCQPNAVVTAHSTFILPTRSVSIYEIILVEIIIMWCHHSNGFGAELVLSSRIVHTPGGGLNMIKTCQLYEMADICFTNLRSISSLQFVDMKLLT